MITLDGNTLDYFGLKLQKGHSHPTPVTRDKTIVIPGKHGAWDFGAELNERQFNLPLVFIETDNVNLQKRIRTFVSFLFGPNGKPRTFELRFDYESEKYYTVRYSGQISPERLFGLGQFELTLVAFDPFAYADMIAYNTPSYYDQAEEGMYYENTISFQWEYARHYSGVHNYSSINTPLILEIEGTMLNPSITHIESGKKLILPSIFSSRKIEINTEKYTIISNGFNILFETNGEFLTLLPGDNGFLFEANSPNATVTYKWKHKYI